MNSLLCYVDGQRYNFESCRYVSEGGFEVLTQYFAVLFAPVNAVKDGFEGLNFAAMFLQDGRGLWLSILRYFLARISAVRMVLKYRLIIRRFWR